MDITNPHFIDVHLQLPEPYAQNVGEPAQNSLLPDPDEACFYSQTLLACPSGPEIQSKEAATYHHSQLAFHVMDQTDLLLRFTWPQHSFHISMKSSCFPPPLYVVSLLKKQRHHFAHKDPYSQSYGFSSSPVQMWELDHKKDWVSKNWCFQIVVLEKTLESPLDCKKIRPANLKEINPEYSLEGLMLKLKLQYFSHLILKNWLTGKDPHEGRRLKVGGEGDGRGWDG